ncbi:MAG: helix-hairpin-helix domain-containing protein [Candidatus Omnitrophota bacterium]|nr:helix-hairpin-helix domain-containing protein [Candidatus Omnitrophota bacterium]
MLQLNLTRQEKNVILAVTFAALVGIGISYLFKVMPKAGEIYATPSFNKPLKVNINTADKEQLAELPLIGPKTAQAIIDYRIKNGKFTEINQLKNIKGISEKKIEKIKAFLILE